MSRRESTPRARLSGRRAHGQIVAYTAAVPLLAVLLISPYLGALLRLSPEEWHAFAAIVAVTFVVLVITADRINRRLHRPIARALDRIGAASATSEDIRAGFAAVANFPRAGFLCGCALWPVGSACVGLAMYAHFEDLSAFSAQVMFLAGSCGGLVSMVFFYYGIKRGLEPLRIELAARIADPRERHALVRPISIKRKLLVSVTAVTLLTVSFSVVLAQVRTARAIERHTTDAQRRVLARATRALGAGNPDLDAALGVVESFAVSTRLVLLDADASRVVDGPAGALTAGEIRAIREIGADRGDSTSFDSPNVLAWERLPRDGRVLVSITPWNDAWASVGDARSVFGALLAVSVVLAVGIAYLAADDVSRPTGTLRAAAERIASGDLTRAAGFETDDELGTLARSFERMALELRAMLGDVARTADRVDAAALKAAGFTESVVQKSAEQAEHTDRSRVSMDGINERAREIASSAQGLRSTAEMSADAVLELGVATGDLNESAGVLSAKVQEVSTSIEQLVESARRVGQNTEGLGMAADETSSSVQQMAISVREVDANASEVSQLARRMVGAADSGRERVRETIAGMEAIREATATAERVIRGLGRRSEEIGTILNVIDDVADETSLLALNAAIIAAQAGDNGRSFSVVADEIKDLADRVLRSTKEIGDVIRAVQAESSNAIGAIERGARSVHRGVELSAEAGVALEEITSAARASGSRIDEIVLAMRAQTQSANHVVELMARVNAGIGEIRAAGRDQDRDHVVVLSGVRAMHDVAVQVGGTAEQQSLGVGRIREGSEATREWVGRIHATLQEQSDACGRAADFLERVTAHARSNEESARRIGEAMRELQGQAERLREGVQRFCI
ncbi:MAG: methyl-accepting chemotaxis protein [Deltaproteobacteria bacterium]|nr:MAG: methyl-accepting chemotaxis protein [Deltaproteobacteria bacterium]